MGAPKRGRLVFGDHQADVKLPLQGFRILPAPFLVNGPYVAGSRKFEHGSGTIKAGFRSSLGDIPTLWLYNTNISYIYVFIYGWLSKLWSLLGSLGIIRHLVFKGPKRGP